jgi:hypothetical protein
MKSSLWLLGIMLVSPAWSQEPPANTPVLTPQSFDRNSDSIKKIVHDAAASQSVLVQLSEETPVKREPYTTIEYAPPVVAPPAKIAKPRPTAPAPAREGPVSQIFDAVIDTLLDVDSDDGQYEWHSCQSPQRDPKCPGVDPMGNNPSPDVTPSTR